MAFFPVIKIPKAGKEKKRRVGFQKWFKVERLQCISFEAVKTQICMKVRKDDRSYIK